MNRRWFLLSAAASPIAVALVWPHRKYGRMDPLDFERLRHSGVHLRVFLDGVDISERCREADDTEGLTLCYKHRDGKPYWEHDSYPELVKETLRGHVEFRRVST